MQCANAAAATRYLFQAPRKGTREAANFYGVTAAKVPHKRNDDGGPGQGDGTHAARAQQKLFKEANAPSAAMYFWR